LCFPETKQLGFVEDFIHSTQLLLTVISLHLVLIELRQWLI